VLPASHNTWVILRFGLAAIWSSWLNKLVVFFFWLPFAGLALLAGFRYMTVGAEMPEIPPEAGETARWFIGPPALWIRSLVAMQFWFFVTLVTLRSGAGLIAGDFTNKAYQFYFAKPVTPAQYLIGRTGALALFLFFIVFVPVLLMVFVLAAAGPEDQIGERIGLILPALLDSAILAVTGAVLAVGASSLSKSRALTFTAWILLLVVPFALAKMVEAMTDTEWLFITSPPALMWVIGDDLYKVSNYWDQLHWYHAVPLLAALTAGAGFLAWTRIREAEVIT
jgi:hypothetical protein